uniref:Tyrosine-protein phosphatase domain-containing protein n=1 Tax=Panagrolaimus sp. JU765 TaxID=591449 RepID=A0AC34QAP8_9BILA
MKATAGKKQSAVQIKRAPKKIAAAAGPEKDKEEKTRDDRSAIGVADSAKKRHVIETPVIPPIDTAPTDKSRIVMRRFATIVMAKGVESLLQEFNELKISCPTVDQLKHASFDRNMDKNRYKDIICVDDSRVVLTWPPGMQDYIHANWVTGTGASDDHRLLEDGVAGEGAGDPDAVLRHRKWEKEVRAVLAGKTW